MHKAGRGNNVNFRLKCSKVRFSQKMLLLSIDQAVGRRYLKVVFSLNLNSIATWIQVKRYPKIATVKTCH
jgi:hypothetical protein